MKVKIDARSTSEEFFYHKRDMKNQTYSDMGAENYRGNILSTDSHFYILWLKP